MKAIEDKIMKGIGIGGFASTGHEGIGVGILLAEVGEYIGIGA